MINLNNIDICNSQSLENSISQYKFKDITELPYIQFPQTRNLPAIVGIYFVIGWVEDKKKGGIVYIGGKNSGNGVDRNGKKCKLIK